MAGFESPNYTQVPNDLFDRLGEFEKADLKVLLAVIRATFGYHRDRAKITTREMATITRLSVASIQPAAEKLEKMGLIEQIKDGKSTTTWRAVVSGDSMVGTKKKKRDSMAGTAVIQPLVQRDSTIGTPQPSLKKEKEKEINYDDVVGEILQNYKIRLSSNTNHLITEWLKYHELDKIERVASEHPERHVNYLDTILINWQAQGYPPTRQDKIEKARKQVEPTFTNGAFHA